MKFDYIRRLNNGVTVYALPTRKFKTASLRLVFQRPLGAEASQNALISAIIQRGCLPWPTTIELARRLEKLYGAFLGGGVEKIGERQTLEFHLGVVNNRYFPGENLLSEGLETLRAVIENPLLEEGGFRADYFQQEKENLRQRIRGLINDKRRYAIFRAVRNMCANEPFSTYKYGSEQDLDAMSPQGLYSHYRSVLQTSPVAVLAVGDFPPEEVEQWVERDFLAARGQACPLPATLVHVPVQDEKEVVEEEQVQQSTLVMGFRTYTGYDDPDYYAQVMANGIFGSFPHSKLFLNVRERASLAYYTHSHLEATKGLLLVSAGIEAANYDKALGIIRDQVKAMQDGEISDAEMAATKSSLASAWQSMDDDPDQIIDSAVVGLVNGRLPSTEKAIAAIDAMTREDVVRAARKWRLDTTYFLRPRT